MHLGQRVALALALGNLCLVLGCEPGPVKLADSGNANSATSGYVTSGKSTRWPSHDISVCWDLAPANGAEAASRLLVQAAVEDTYGAAPLGFMFRGWDDCSPGAKGVHLATRDETPSVQAYGDWLDGRPGGVVLNFDFAKAGVAACRESDKQAACIKTYAVHEFGHVLGLRHEANRPGNHCPEQDQTGGLGEAGGVAVGAYDADSVMNYCKVNQLLGSGVPAQLSGGDVSTLSAYYTEQQSATLPDLGAACAKDLGSRTAWNSISNCCDLTQGNWQPPPVPDVAPGQSSLGVAYRSCKLPRENLQRQACTYAQGRFDQANSCCQMSTSPKALPRWNSFFVRCL